MNQHKRIRASV